MLNLRLSVLSIPECATVTGHRVKYMHIPVDFAKSAV